MKIIAFYFKFLHNKMKRLLTFFIKASFLKVFYGYKPPISIRFFDLNSFVLYLHNLSIFLLLLSSKIFNTILQYIINLSIFYHKKLYYIQASSLHFKQFMVSLVQIYLHSYLFLYFSYFFNFLLFHLLFFIFFIIFLFIFFKFQLFRKWGSRDSPFLFNVGGLI